ncbi:MAG: hypothetical protein KatS3mg111_3330 [Pirellulaceae bacterium]|nr:MAG: hypothetical protein KatS3mg111_3330 [Pirellulaceae bacterium]
MRLRHWLLLGMMLFMARATMGEEKQAIEVRIYKLQDEAAEKRLDDYLQHALLPALNRQGLGPIGVLDQAQAGEVIEVLLIIPGESVEAVAMADLKLYDDPQYLEAAKDYLAIPAKAPILRRITSELLWAFDCWPQVAVPPQREAGKPRLFEMRTYESPTEHLGHLKVEMFNSGEVPIFLDCGIQPVFMGQALIGNTRPSLTYMTVYDDQASLEAAWERFREHPDWQVLREVPKYKGTVSKIHQSWWVPKPYSQL